MINIYIIIYYMKGVIIIITEKINHIFSDKTSSTSNKDSFHRILLRNENSNNFNGYLRTKNK